MNAKLKKWYFELISIFFLLVSISILSWFYVTINKFGEIKFPETTGASYKREDLSKYKPVEELAVPNLWNNGGKQVKLKESTDLINPIVSARCVFCQKIIPVSDFKIKHKCSFCRSPLPKPKPFPKKIIDSDRDGIPDQVEIDNGLNHLDPSDAKLDKDGDGFDNLHEYKISKTNINDPKSRPYLARNLVFNKIKSNKLPLIFKEVKKGKSNNKRKWLVQVFFPYNNKTDFKSIGDILSFKNYSIEIMDIEYKQAPRFGVDKKFNLLKDVSEIVINLKCKKRKENLLRTVKIGETIYDPRQTVSLKDTLSGKVYKNLYKDGKFILGNKTLGIEKYLLEDINPRKNLIIVLSLSKNKSENDGEVRIFAKKN